MGPTAIAQRYAEALYELAQQAGKTQSVLGELAEVKRALDANPDAWRRLLNPRSSAAEKEALLSEGPLTGKDRLVVNTFRLILRKRREEILPVFFSSYLDVHERREGILRIEVETATPLEASEQEVLRDRLTSATKHPVVLEARTVPELLGGMRLTLGSRLVDGSLKSRLERVARGLRAAPAG